MFSKKKSAPRLLELEAMFGALDRALAIIWFDPAGIVLDANESFLSLTGYSLEDIKGKSHSIFVAPDHASSDEYAEFWNKLGSGEFTTGEFTRLRKDGRTIVVDATYSPVLDASGNVEKIANVAIDVTDRAMKGANAGSQLAAITKSQAVVEFDLDGTISTANQKFLSTTGYTLDEIQGKHHSMFVEPDFAESSEYKEFWRNLGNGKYEAGEFYRLGKGGREIWLQASYNPIQDPNGTPYKVIQYASDITEAKRKAIAFEGEINAISRSQAVIEFELDGTIITANENFLHVMGYELDEIVGKNHAIFVDPDYAASSQFKEFWKDLGNGALKSDVFQHIGKSGDPVWIQASYNPVFDPDGVQYKVVKFATNVTPWKSELQTITDALAKMAKGDLTVRLPRTESKDFADIRDSFNTVTENFQHLIASLVEVADSIQTEATAIAESAHDLSSRCERQASTVEETSAAMEEMSTSVKSNAENAKGATEAARNASDFAEKGGKIVDDAIEAMNKIESGSAEVRKIIEVIDAIAFQTNLLALNAGVEAARAGDAGRGFAVVASEVRALAQRASDSARDINSLIESSGSRVAEGAALVNQAGTSLKDIVGAVGEASSGIEGIFTASSEQAEGVNEINQAILNIDATTQKTAAISEESTAAASTLVERANGLLDLVRFFSVGDQAPEISAQKPAGAKPLPRTEVEPAKEAPYSSLAKTLPSAPVKTTATDGALALKDELDEDDGWDEF